MPIVFGIKYFIIASFTPFELGFTDDRSYTGILYERHQMYFHLFWIPVFGLGKRWVKTHSNGDAFELSHAEFEHIYRKNVGGKSPWYRFAGLILGLFIFLGFAGYSMYENYRYEQLSLAWKNEQNALIKNPRIGDTYVFSSTGNVEIHAEVHAVKQDSVLFTIQIPPKNEVIQIESDSLAAIRRKKEQELIQYMLLVQKARDSIRALNLPPQREQLLADLRLNCKIRHIQDSNEVFQFVWIPKKELLAAKLEGENPYAESGIWIKNLLFLCPDQLTITRLERSHF